MGFGNFHFSAVEGGKLLKQDVPQPPWEPPPPPPPLHTLFDCIVGRDILISDSDTGVSRGLTRSGIENKDALMPDSGVHCL